MHYMIDVNTISWKPYIQSSSPWTFHNLLYVNLFLVPVLFIYIIHSPRPLGLFIHLLKPPPFLHFIQSFQLVIMRHINWTFQQQPVCFTDTASVLHLRISMSCWTSFLSSSIPSCLLWLNSHDVQSQLRPS